MRFSLSRVAVTTILVLGLAACGDSPTGGNNNQEAQLAASADVTVEVSGYIETAATAYSFANIVPGLTKSAAIFAGCPNFYFNLQARQFTLDYGSGCTGKDGRTRSGTITVQFSGKLSAGATLTLTYNNYKTNDKTFSGQIAATISNNNTIALVISDATVTDDNGTATVNANLTMTANLNDTPQAPDDDVYAISGAGTVNEGGKTYSFTISDPLLFQVGCNFPTSGKMAITTTNSPDATIDFFPDNGACDDVAVVTIGGASKRIMLGA
jgi:hypothetical protein